MQQLISDYKRLKAQLVNEGCEESPSEVMWNDSILIAMDELLEDVNGDIKRLIKLNLI